MSGKSFSPMPLVDPRSNILFNIKNLKDGLTEQAVIKNVEMFIDDINTGKFDIISHFSWYEKPVPLVVKYLLWKGINVVTPAEEIMQIIAYEKGSKFSGTEQWWHNYADAGFDVFTPEQFERLLGDNICYYKQKLWKKGLVLLSTNPGPKYKTRNNDHNNPLRWSEKKKEFDYSCATCGDKEKSLSSSNGIPVRLEKGHVDPRLPYSHNNIIPQCGSCNNHSDAYVYGPSENDPKRYIVIEKLTGYNRWNNNSKN